MECEKCPFRAKLANRNAELHGMLRTAKAAEDFWKEQFRMADIQAGRIKKLIRRFMESRRRHRVVKVEIVPTAYKFSNESDL